MDILFDENGYLQPYEPIKMTWVDFTGLQRNQ